jgi:Thioesterase domain
MPELSEAKRALLEKYLRGGHSQTTMAASDVPKQAEAEQTNQREGVVAIKPTGSKRPFFFLHGQWKSQAFYCFPLAHGLGSDQPFYVLEPYAFDGLPVAPTFEEIAAAHIKSLRTVQPEGPYQLGGWCNGALMAYEIARQLHAEGQKVDLLVLMNPMALVYPIRYRLLPAVLKLLGKLVRLSQDRQLDWYIRLRGANIYRVHVIDYLRIHYRRLKVALRVASAEQVELVHKAEKEGIAFPRLRSYIPRTEALREDYESVFTWVTLGYKPAGLYPGRITFFWSSTDWTSKEPFHIGWRKVEEANEVEIHIFPGLHMSLVTEQLNLLIESLRKCLSKAQNEESKKHLTSERV